MLVQVRDNCPGDLPKWYRHISKGAWPFSTRDHGWPISDCSADGLKVCALFYSQYVYGLMPDSMTAKVVVYTNMLEYTHTLGCLSH